MGSIPFGVVKWLELIWKTDLPPNAKYLAAYLRTFMNDKSDMAWPSYARIVSETGLSKSTVAKYLEFLDGQQWLIRDKGNSTKNTRYHASIPQKVSQDLIENAIGGSTTHGLRSTRDGLGVVRETDTNKQVNKQKNKQDLSKSKISGSWDELASQILDYYLNDFRPHCKVKGFFKDQFLKSKERMKVLNARINENKDHESFAFWKAYFDNCKNITWIRDGINGDAVCTIDMLINKTKFYRHIEEFWA